MTLTPTDEPWSVKSRGTKATITIDRDLEADDAFALRAALAALVADDCTGVVFDVVNVNYLAHSVQAAIRDEAKRHEVTLRGVTDRLRRILSTDNVQLLTKVSEEAAA
jgi:hypothetical protein